MIAMKHITRTIPVISFCFALCFSIVLNAQSMRDDVLKYTNDLRKSQGLPALEMRDDLNELALKHSTNMAKGKTSFGHDGFEQRRVAASKTLPKLSGFGENVAYGASTGKDVVNMWKKSPGHRKNMLGNYRYIGIGIAADSDGTLYYTQVFVN
jgi:uncharacterized protein YkwD